MTRKLIEEKYVDKTNRVYQGRNGDPERRHGMCKGMDNDLAIPERLTLELWGKGPVGYFVPETYLLPSLRAASADRATCSRWPDVWLISHEFRGYGGCGWWCKP